MAFNKSTTFGVVVLCSRALWNRCPLLGYSRRVLLWPGALGDFQSSFTLSPIVLARPLLHYILCVFYGSVQDSTQARLSGFVLARTIKQNADILPRRNPIEPHACRGEILAFPFGAMSWLCLVLFYLVHREYSRCRPRTSPMEV